MIPQLLVHLLFGLSFGCMSAYFLSLRGYTFYVSYARMVYFAIVAGTLLISALQMWNIVNHNFDIHYVYAYSSRELAPPFLYASFYSGQEGSFMLWTVMTALLGVFLLPYARKHNYEAPVMFFYSLILCFLFLMLVAKNPFSFLWETFAKDGTTEAFIDSIRNDPARYNGKGMNPVLQNRWIMIHPPILFAGFAAMSVPFVFAMGGLIRREYQRWIQIALPWALFACAVLGFGIMLGGFWAYVTLGWGGFWAWDPVENSSLIPWLVCVAMVHTMLVQQRTKGLVKTNVVLALLGFLSVLYSTFLTRSGVLGDTSVHAFVEPGFFVYVLLLVFLSCFALIGVGLIVWRMRDMAKMNDSFSPSSREFSLGVGSSLLLASALIVTLGTSYPMLAEIFGKPKVAVEGAFYNMTHQYLMMIVFLVNALSMALSWKATPTAQIRSRIQVAALGALLVTALSYAVGLREPIWLILAFLSWTSLIINVRHAISLVRKSIVRAGAYISHFGVALMLLGVIATAGYTETQHARMVEGRATEVLGYTLNFKGKLQVEQEYKDREKYEYHIEVARNGTTQMVHPVLYYSDFNQRQSAFLEPGIAWTLGRDLYVSPKAIEREGKPIIQEVVKSSTVAFPFDSSRTLELRRFDMSEAQKSDMPGYLKLAVVAHINSADSGYDKKLYCYTNGTEFIPISYSIPGTSLKVSVNRIHRNQQNPELSSATFAFSDSSKPETLEKEVFVADVSVKPYINFVWLGVITMVLGFVLAMIRTMRSKASNSVASINDDKKDDGEASPTGQQAEAELQPGH